MHFRHVIIITNIRKKYQKEKSRTYCPTFSGKLLLTSDTQKVQETALQTYKDFLKEKFSSFIVSETDEYIKWFEIPKQKYLDEIKNVKEQIFEMIILI